MPAERTGHEQAIREVGKRVAKLRRNRKLSQEDLAEAASIHTNHVSMIERGVANPSLAVLLAIARALGESIVTLVDRIDDDSRPKRMRR